MKKGIDKIALVTGGSRGIGRGISIALAAAGAAVAVAYKSNAHLAEEAAAEITSKGGAAMAIRMRMEDRESVRKAFIGIRKRLGAVTILVNNAAMAQEKPFDAITDDDWDTVMGVNLRGPFSCCQEALPDMIKRKGGRIINITSIGGQWGGVNQVHYAVSKAGLICLTRSLAGIYSRHNITINAVSPGLVATDMTAAELASPAGRRKMRSIPAGRIAEASEVASAVVFLASDEASYITGQTINVNGGMYFG